MNLICLILGLRFNISNVFKEALLIFVKFVKLLGKFKLFQLFWALHVLCLLGYFLNYPLNTKHKNKTELELNTIYILM